MDNRVDNLTLVPTWISRLEQDSILELRCTESSIWTERQQQQQGRSGTLPHPEPGRSRHTYESNSNLRASAEGQESDDDFNPSGEDNKREKRRGENSLYWKAITQLLANETDEVITDI